MPPLKYVAINKYYIDFHIMNLDYDVMTTESRLRIGGLNLKSTILPRADIAESKLNPCWVFWKNGGGALLNPIPQYRRSERTL